MHENKVTIKLVNEDGDVVDTQQNYIEYKAKVVGIEFRPPVERTDPDEIIFVVQLKDQAEDEKEPEEDESSDSES